METLATECPHVINFSKQLQQRWGLKTSAHPSQQEKGRDEATRKKVFRDAHYLIQRCIGINI